MFTILTLLILSTCELSTTNRATADVGKCIGCHDGTAGMSVGSGDAMHMVGGAYNGDYGKAWRGKRGFKPLSFGSPVVLVDGRVTCTSCHDPASRRKFHVAARDLCTECHAK